MEICRRKLTNSFAIFIVPAHKAELGFGVRLLNGRSRVQIPLCVLYPHFLRRVSLHEKWVFLFPLFVFFTIQPNQFTPPNAILASSILTARIIQGRESLPQLFRRNPLWTNPMPASGCQRRKPFGIPPAELPTLSSVGADSQRRPLRSLQKLPVRMRCCQHVRHSLHAPPLPDLPTTLHIHRWLKGTGFHRNRRI